MRNTTASFDAQKREELRIAWQTHCQKCRKEKEAKQKEQGNGM